MEIDLDDIEIQTEMVRLSKCVEMLEDQKEYLVSVIQPWDDNRPSEPRQYQWKEGPTIGAIKYTDHGTHPGVSLDVPLVSGDTPPGAFVDKDWCVLTAPRDHILVAI